MLNKKIERKAKLLRRKLEIDSKTILNHKHLEELSQKIKKHLENFVIVSNAATSGLVVVTMQDKTVFEMHLCGNEEKRFYDLVRQLTYAVLLKEEPLNGAIAQKEYISLNVTRPCKKSETPEEYLNLAFMMPKKSFLSKVKEYSPTRGTIRISDMTKKVNKYSYERWLDLKE